VQLDIQINIGQCSWQQTLDAVLAAMGIGVVMTYPNISTWPLIAVVVSVALIVGIGGFPISYTVWLAVDLRMNPLSEEEKADSAAHTGIQ